MMGENIFIAIIFSIFFMALALAMLYILIKKQSKNILGNVLLIIVLAFFLFLSAKFALKSYNIHNKYENIDTIHQKLQNSKHNHNLKIFNHNLITNI